jgi:beta-lactamase regulating signal transducer with metallopeptidase domain
MTRAVDLLSLWLADYYLLSAALLALAVLAMAALKQPAHRLAVLKSTFVGLFLLGILCSLPNWSLVHLIAADNRDHSAEVQVIADISAPATAESDAFQRQEPIAAAPVAAPAVTVDIANDTWNLPRVNWRTSLSVAFVCGAVLVVGWLSYGWVAARRLRRAAKPAPLDIARLLTDVATKSGSHHNAAELLTSDRIDVAVALGFWRPAVLLPRDWIETQTRDQLRSVLAHEWSHVENHDVQWLAASRMLLVILWAQPLYWLLRRRMRLDQEALADAAAAELTSRQRYAEQLVAWARTVGTGAAMRVPSAVGLWEGPSQLRQRIALLIDSRFTVVRVCSRRLNTTAAVALAVAAVSLSLVTLQPSSEAADEASKPTARENAEGSLEYKGTVVDKNSKKPLSGATVVVRRQTSSKFPWPTLAETTHVTAADGTYQFTIPPEQLADKKLYIELDVTHPNYAPRTDFGYALSMIRKNEKLGGRPFFEKVELMPGESIAGIVKTPDGKPAADMPILAYSKSDPKDMSEYGSFTRGQTDNDGRFSINVTKDGDAILWLLPDTYSQETHVLKNKRGDLGSFTLSAGTRLKGQVIDHDGKPIPDVWVNAELRGGPSKKQFNMPVSDSIGRSALTDANGNFELAALPAGEYRVVPDGSPEENPRRDREPRPLSAAFLPMTVEIPAEREAAPLKIQAAETVVIEAQIYDSAGKPRSGHEIHFHGFAATPKEEFYSAHGRPDKDGRIVLKVPMGLRRCEIDLSCNEHQVLRYKWSPTGSLFAGRELKLDRITEDIRGIEIYYYTAPIVTVRAVDSDGKPVAEFKPAIFYRSGVKPRQEGSRWISGVDGEVNFEKQEDGRWRSEQLLPDEEFILTVFADGYQPASEALTLTEGSLKDVSIVLHKKPVDVKDASEESSKTSNFSAIDGRIILAQVTKPAADATADPKKRPPAILSYGDGKPDGKKSYGGSGHLIQFELPKGITKVRGIRIHGSRYGLPEAPKEDFEITFLSEKGDETLHSEAAPYHLFKRGKENWVRVMFEKEVELPEKFWVALNFNPHQTKGVYLSYDTSTKGQHSRVGLPGDEDEPKETDFGGDWMVQVMLAKPEK